MNKTVLITGGARGIGAACARVMAERGCNIIINYNTSQKEAEALKAELSGTQITLARGDITSPEFVKSLFAREIDYVINNAAVSYTGLLCEMSDADWARVINVNLTACFYTCREALKKMMPAGGGAIINITSMWGERGASCEAAYSAAKAGLAGLTKALAKEAGPSGVRVNAIAPGVIDTAMNAHLTAEDLKTLADETPLCRIGTPREAALAAAFLLSDQASFITGQVLGVDGGYAV